MLEENPFITTTKNWIKNVVIGQNFCPFAGAAFINDSIRYRVDDGLDILGVLQEEFDFLDQNPNCETSLIIYPEGLNDWMDYLDWIDIAQGILLDKGLEGTYQLASFHPNYLFEGAKEDDVANYTNRSPYPMLHLLRESSIDQAVEGSIDVDSIPERNEAHARSLGIQFFNEILKKSQAY